jgi:hypothetical protein
MIDVMSKEVGQQNYLKLDPNFAFLSDISHSIQYTLNCPVGIYNLQKPNDAHPTELRIVHSDQSHYNFKKLYLLILDENEIYYILPARYNSRLKLAEQEASQIDPQNFDNQNSGSLFNYLRQQGSAFPEAPSQLLNGAPGLPPKGNAPF